MSSTNVSSSARSARVLFWCKTGWLRIYEWKKLSQETLNDWIIEFAWRTETSLPRYDKYVHLASRLTDHSSTNDSRRPNRATVNHRMSARVVMRLERLSTTKISCVKKGYTLSTYVATGPLWHDAVWRSIGKDDRSRRKYRRSIISSWTSNTKTSFSILSVIFLDLEFIRKMRNRLLPKEVFRSVTSNILATIRGEFRITFEEKCTRGRDSVKIILEIEKMDIFNVFVEADLLRQKNSRGV